MSTDSVQRRLPAEQWDSGDEIDLTRYLNVLRHRWQEILLVTLAVVGGLSLLTAATSLVQPVLVRSVLDGIGASRPVGDVVALLVAVGDAPGSPRTKVAGND